MYVHCPFTKNWNIGLIRECGMGSSGFSCSRRQSVTAARRSSTMDDEGPRAAQSGSENHFLVASLHSYCLIKDPKIHPRACSLGSSDVKLIKTTGNAALEATSLFPPVLISLDLLLQDQ